MPPTRPPGRTSNRAFGGRHADRQALLPGSIGPPQGEDGRSLGHAPAWEWRRRSGSALARCLLLRRFGAHKHASERA